MQKSFAIAAFIVATISFLSTAIADVHPIQLLWNSLPNSQGGEDYNFRLVKTAQESTSLNWIIFADVPMPSPPPGFEVPSDAEALVEPILLTAPKLTPTSSWSFVSTTGFHNGPSFIDYSMAPEPLDKAGWFPDNIGDSLEWAVRAQKGATTFYWSNMSGTYPRAEFEAAITCEDMEEDIDGDSIPDCADLQVCGNGITEEAEECDAGGNSPNCDADCTLAICGDGYTNPAAGEACDDRGNSESCDEDCTPSICGDGLVNDYALETCDPGAETVECNGDCSFSACGDGYINFVAGESCDGEEGCSNMCQWSLCGDGILQEPFEECDPGQETIRCDPDCTFSVCGDGYINSSAGEECEGAGCENCTYGSGGCLIAGEQKGRSSLILLIFLALTTRYFTRRRKTP